MTSITVIAMLLGLIGNVDVAAIESDHATAAQGAMTLEVRVDAGLTDRKLGLALINHLRAELAASHVAVLAPGDVSGSRADARLTVGPVSGDPQAVSLEVQYLRSGTAVHRILDLTSLPHDSALLAIAVAVDELLRSSWSLSGVEAGRVPPAATRTSPGPVAAEPHREIRLLLATERHQDSIFTVGPDVVLQLHVGSRISFEVRGGWRWAGTRQAANGTIASSSVTSGAGLAIALPARAATDRAGAELATRIDFAWVSMRGTPRTGAIAHDATAFGLAAVGGVGGWFVLAKSLRLIGSAGWQLPLRRVTALDADRPVGTVFRPGLSAAAGVGARF